MSWDIFSKSKIQYFLQKLKDKFVQKETGKGLSTNDYTTTEKNKVGKIDTTTTSISGNPISISGLKSNQLAINPIITLEPIQAGSGTPSPSNIRAISGYDKIEVLSCEKNLITLVKANTAVNGNGEEYANDSCCLANAFNIVQGVSYSVSWQNKTGDLIAHKYNNNTYIGYVRLNDVKIFTFNDCNLVKLQWNGSVGSGSLLPTNPLADETNKTTDLSESLGQTVYGGTLDVRTGKLTVDRKYISLNGGEAETWYYAQNVFYWSLGGTTDGIQNDNLAICNSYKYAQVPSFVGIVNGEFICNSTQIGNATNFGARDDRFSTVEAWKANLQSNPIQFVYKLKDSAKFTIQLTPHEISLLKDYAYVSTNGTSISLDYHNGELASLADVSQLGETVNGISQAFQDGCDEIMQAVTAKGQTPASNSPDDISAAIGRIVALPGNMSSETVTMTSDVTSFTVDYNKNKTVEFVIVIPLALVGANYEQTFLVGKLNFLSGSFDQYAGTTINYNSSAEQMQTAANAGSMSFNSSTGKITINTRGSNYKFKSGDIYAVLIVYSVT